MRVFFIKVKRNRASKRYSCSLKRPLKYFGAVHAKLRKFVSNNTHSNVR